MSDPLWARAEQLVQAVRAGGSESLGLARQLLSQAGPEDPGRLRLVRPSGDWNCLSLAFRPGGNCVLDLDGQSFLLGAQVLDETAQEQSFQQTVARVDQGFAQTPVLTRRFSTPDGWDLHGLLSTALVQREPDLIHLEPLERDWLCADGQDELQVVASVEGEPGGHSGLEITPLGPLSVSPPQDGEFYRYWSVRAAPRRSAAVGELWVHGQAQGRPVQRLISLQLRPPLEIAPTPVILLPQHRSRLTLQVGPPQWSVQVSHPSLRVEQRAAGEFEVQLGNQSLGLQAPLAITARRGETTLLREVPVLVAQPGPIVLSHSQTEIAVSVWRWNEARQDLEVVEEALAHVDFSGAALEFRFLRCQGQGLARQGVYRVSGTSREGSVLIRAGGSSCSLPLVLS